MAAEATRSPDLARLMASMPLLEGCKVEVQVQSGVVYEGVYAIGNVEGETPGVLLRFPRVIREPNLTSDKDKVVTKLPKKLFLDLPNIVQVVARDVSIHPDDIPDEFDTDANISKGRAGGFGRELQPWMPDPSEDHGVMLTLEESGTGWDQFAVNEQKFGVRSTYDEHFYTTKIDKNNCAISEAQASRIAREIMQESLNKGGLADYHIAEERGFEIDDKLDEEDRYGAVVREVPITGGPHISSRRTSGQQDAGQQRGPPPARAWGNAGAGVAAVAGRVGGGPGGGSSGGGSSANGAAPVAAPGAAPAVVGGLSQNFAAVAAANRGPPTAPPMPGRANAAATWTSSAAQPSGDMALRQAKPRAPGSAAMPIRSGKHATELDGFGQATDALALALPGPSSTPPDLKYEFGKFKAAQAAKARDAQAQRTLSELKSMQPSKSPGSAAGSQPSPSTSVTGATTIQPPTAAPAAPAASTAAAAPADEKPAAAAVADAGKAAAPAAAASAAVADDKSKPLATAPSKPAGLNPFAKEWVPPGASSTPAAPAAVQPPPPPSLSSATGSFSSKPTSGAGVYAAGPHAIPMHLHGGGPIVMHGGISGHHAGDVHHAGGPGPHVVAVPGPLPTSGDGMNIHHAVVHAPGSGPGAMRIAPIAHGAAPALQDGHVAMPGAGPHSHGMPMAMPSGAMQPMTTTPGATMPYVVPPSMGLGPGQPMSISSTGPANVIQAHPMMGTHPVMFQPGAQGPHGVRPATMPASGAQQMPMGVTMVPAGGGFGYMQGGQAQGFAIVPGGPGAIAGAVPIAHGAVPMQMAHGQQHGGDMTHIGRGPRPAMGMSMGMGPGGRGGGRGSGNMMHQGGRGMGQHHAHNE